MLAVKTQMAAPTNDHLGKSRNHTAPAATAMLNSRLRGAFSSFSSQLLSGKTTAGAGLGLGVEVS